MFRTLRVLALLAAVGVPAAWAQFPSEVVGFNGPPIDVPATSQEMFRAPQFNSLSATFILPNTGSNFDRNAAFRASGAQTEGEAALRVFFTWANPANPDAWVRLTTFDGPVRPNPALNTEGKVRFKLVNISEFFAGEIGICLGIRETGTLVPQMANGGTSGPIEWVGVSTTPNGITAGADMIVNTTAAGDDVQVYPVGTNLTTLGLPSGTAVVTPGPNGVIDTAPAGDDQLRRGYTLDANGNRRPLPVAILPPNPAAAELEFNLVTGEVKVNGVSQGGGIAGLTGDGDLSAPNNRGVLEHIAIVNVATDPAAQIDFSIDELQFESPTPDPIVPPRVQPIIVAGDTQVTVSGLVPQVNQVTLYKNSTQIAQQAVTPGTPSVVFTIAPAVTGEVYTAKQRDTVNQVSDFSPPVTVVPFPPSYTFSILLDESGSGSCSSAPPGWEWVGVTSVTNLWLPQGTPLVFRDAVWQTVDVPLNDPAVVRPGLGGNGALAPSPTGFYTMDSIWFTIVPNAGPQDLGPWEVLIDNVELLDSLGQPYRSILSMEDGVNRFPRARSQSSELPDVTALTSSGSYDGSGAHRLVWTYDNTSPTRTLGMLQRVGTQCGTSALIPDTSTAIRFHLLCRGPRTAPGIPLPVVQAPVVGAQNTIVVSHDATATALQVYINGNPVGGPIAPTGTQTTITGLALQYGDSVTVTQTLPGGTSDPAYPRAAGRPLPPTVTAPIVANATNINVTGLMTNPYATASLVKVFANGVLVGTAPGGTASANVTVPPQPLNTVIEATQVVNGVESFKSAQVIVGTPPDPPTVNPPLQAGDTTVKLTGVNPLASLVTVYAGNTPIGSINPNGATSVNVPVTPLVALDQISATASNVSGESIKSVAKEVGRGNGDIYMCIGIRETATTAPIGGNGGTTGAIEWLGSTTTGVPTGKPVTPSNAWQTITFDPATDPVRPFAGGADGVLSSANGKGVLEHIAITVNATSPNRSVGTYVLYVDNFVNVGAGPGGTDVLISDFESVPNNTNFVMFRAPRFSGSTDVNLEDPAVFSGIPNISRSTDAQGNPGQSVQMSFYFRSTAANRWVRLTTFNAPVLPNPAIDLTKPIRFQFLLQQVLPPPAPTVVSPLQQGDTTVTVTNIAANATLVQVFANGGLIGSVNPGGQPTVSVPVPPLVHLDLITAVQSGPGGASAPSEALEVGRGNGDLLITLGIRETGDTGPLGSTGSATGPIEWIGAATQTGGAPQGKSVPVIPGWQTVTFDPATDPVLNFFGGNGVIDGTRGVLEHIAIAVDASSPNRSTGPYTIYIDNVVNVGAGPGGTDFVIADFESFAPGVEALFQPPDFSGSTAGNLSAPPNSAVVSDVTGNPGKSNEVQWFFKDTAASRWVRLTTSGADNLSRPIIDLTRPIRLQVLLGSPGPALCAGDLNCDGQVDFDDIGRFVEALGYPGGVDWPYADCPWLNGDCNGDQRVDFDDIDAFVSRIGASCN